MRTGKEVVKELLQEIIGDLEKTFESKLDSLETRVSVLEAKEASNKPATQLPPVQE